MFEGLTPTHLLFILIIALLVLGPGKLPQTGAALGRATRDFRAALDGKEDLGHAQGSSLPASGQSATPEPGPVEARSADVPGGDTATSGPGPR